MEGRVELRERREAGGSACSAGAVPIARPVLARLWCWMPGLWAEVGGLWCGSRWLCFCLCVRGGKQCPPCPPLPRFPGQCDPRCWPHGQSSGRCHGAHGWDRSSWGCYWLQEELLSPGTRRWRAGLGRGAGGVSKRSAPVHQSARGWCSVGTGTTIQMEQG